MTFILLLGLLAAGITTAPYLPQAYLTITTRSTRSLSLPTYLLGTVRWATGCASTTDPR